MLLSRRCLIAVVALGLFLYGRTTAGADTSNALTADQAKNHIGEVATVCGVVASAKYAVTSHRSPTFLNLDRPYPQHIFTIVIWGDDRGKFGAPETKYANKRLCVTGEIQEYRGKPEIIATMPGQLQGE